MTNPTELLPCPKCGALPCDWVNTWDEVHGTPAPVASKEVERGDAPVNTVDREWAAWLSEINCDDPRVTARMRSGELDSSLHVQAFARHRRDLATTPARAVSREEVAKLNALQDWLREPDHAERFGNREIFDWINRRPTHLVPAIIALIGGGE